MSKVGFIGLGNMGSGMAKNLLDKDTYLNVFTRSKSKLIPTQRRRILRRTKSMDKKLLEQR